MMRLVSANGEQERSFHLTSECVDLLHDALAVLQPATNEADRKRRLLLSMIEEHRNRDRVRRALYR